MFCDVDDSSYYRDMAVNLLLHPHFTFSEALTVVFHEDKKILNWPRGEYSVFAAESAT